MLKKAPSGSRWSSWGPYFLVEFDNGVIDKRIELDKFARELGCVDSWERIDE